MTGYTLILRGDPRAAREYECPTHGRFDVVVDLATSRDPRPCPECAAPSERTIEANIFASVNPLSWIRGKSDEPPSKFAMDTRPLAEGMPLKEWKAKRRAMWRDHDRQKAKDRGLISTKVTI